MVHTMPHVEVVFPVNRGASLRNESVGKGEQKGTLLQRPFYKTNVTI